MQQGNAEITEDSLRMGVLFLLAPTVHNPTR
jgi:hypothetical protein